ncbi:MAG: DUF2793 domain-containing protein [Candidatus Acidiferrales bacterium]
MPDSSSVTTGPKLGLANYADIGANFPNSLRALLRGIDALVQASVLSVTTAAPPGSPSDGDAYVVAASATGAWSGKDGQIAVWSAAIATADTNTKVPAWEFHAPKAGWLVFNSGDTKFYAYNGTSWIATNVGVSAPTFSGAVTSDEQIVVNNGSYPQIILCNGAGTFHWTIQENTGDGTQGPIRIYDYVAGKQRFAIDTSGNVSLDVPLGVASGGTGSAGALPEYANNAAAISGGLSAGSFYRTGGDPDAVCVVH